MSMMEWAKREVEIASKRERGDKPESEWDYGCACYDSALKAFESLCGDGHSGFSIGITKGILNRLIEGKGKENTILKEWAKGYTVHYLDHTYSNCSYHKKDKQSKDIEVFITNY